MTEGSYEFVVYFGLAWLLVGLAVVAAMAIGDIRKLARGEE